MTQRPKVPTIHERALQQDVAPDRPIVLVNVFFPKPGRLDEFLALQISEGTRLGDAALALGWRGNRIHRARDGQTAIILTVFESAAAQARWAESDAFLTHLGVIEPLLDRVESIACDLVAAHGDV